MPCLGPLKLPSGRCQFSLLGLLSSAQLASSLSAMLLLPPMMKVSVCALLACMAKQGLVMTSLLSQHPRPRVFGEWSKSIEESMMMRQGLRRPNLSKA